MHIVIHIGSDAELGNAEATARVIQNHPELHDADEITVVSDHLGGKVTTVYPSRQEGSRELARVSGESAEQQARDLLERCGVEDAQSFSAGDVVELANLIGEHMGTTPVRQFPAHPESHAGYYEQQPTCVLAMMDHNAIHACYRDPGHSDYGRRDDDAHICLCGTVWESRQGEMPTS